MPVFALLGPTFLRAQNPPGEPATSPTPAAPTHAETEEALARAGPFSIGGQQYVVLLLEKTIPGASGLSAQTLTGMEIRDMAGNLVYEKAFAYQIGEGRFLRSVSATEQSSSGNTGRGLMMRYSEHSATPAGDLVTSEWWQLFGLVNGKIAPLGKPAPIGDRAPSDPAEGAAAQSEDGSGAPASQLDTIELPAWTGSFRAMVPLRTDWNHGKLTPGARCIESTVDGSPQQGCDMRVEAVRKPSRDEFAFVRLFAEAHEKPGGAEHDVLQQDSNVEILGCHAITNWTSDGDAIRPVLSDVWLHLRIDDHEGWIHGDDDFTAVGLPAGRPDP